MKKIIIGLLIVFGIPTTIAAVYRSYLKNGSELVISEVSSIELYKKCMMTIATLSPSKERDAKKILMEIKSSLPKVKETDIKMARVNNLVGEKTGNVGAIALQLDSCVGQLEHELNMSSK